MTQPWGFNAEPAQFGDAGDVLTLVEGSLFCISVGNGDIPADTPHGLFFRDVRCLSRWELRVDGHSPQPLAAYRHEPFSATYVTRVPPSDGRADSHLLVLRRRYLGDGMREDVVVRNLGPETVGCAVTLLLDADFADVFAVKENRVVPHPERITTLPGSGGPGLDLTYRWLGHQRGVHVSSTPPPTAQADGVLSYAVAIPPRQEWSTSLQVRFSIDGAAIEPAYAVGQPPELARPARRGREWTDRGPVITTPYAPLDAALRTGQRDLGALRIQDPDHPEREVVAAGAPWFMTVFGRDSLLSAWMALPVDPDLTLGTLQTLARFQGTDTDPLTEEQPGRILHEMRFGVEAGLVLGGGNVYYGTVDATPLFVMLLGEAHSWGMADDELRALLPHADAALDWMTTYGDRDGDLFLEYQRATDRGLANQGWKDSGDGINDARGRLPTTPLALCEVQGYAYGAYVARSDLARDLGDDAGAERWAAAAVALKRAFNDAFWLPERGYYAVALDDEKRPVDALTSNIGHCLWTGIVDEDKAASVVKHLMSDQMFTGWGVRTLAADMGAYNPLSYHNGSVWPHDNALVVAGLMRYGYVEQAHRLACALLEASASFGGRLPELWCGFDRSEFSAPLPYPTSCSPQAWAAVSPVLLLRSLLGLQPRLPRRELGLDPRLPAQFLPCTIDNLRLGSARVRVEVDHDGWRVEGLPPSISLLPR